MEWIIYVTDVGQREHFDMVFTVSIKNHITDHNRILYLLQYCIAVVGNHILSTLILLQAAKRAGWLPAEDNKYPRTNHVGFGLVLGEDGKRFRTRSTEVVRLVDLLDEAKSRCRDALIERGMILLLTHNSLFMFFPLP